MRSSVRTSIPARPPKRRRPPPLRTGSMCPWCACRRFTTRSRKVSLPLQSRCIAKRACAHISERDAIVGRRHTFSMLPTSTGWRSRKPSRTQGITPSRKKVCRCAILRKRLADASSYRPNPSPRKRPKPIGWLAMFAGLDAPASSAQTRRKLGWEPTGPGLIADLERLQVSDR